MTQVKFLIEKEGDTVFAFFPEMDYNVNLYGKEMKTCYAHLGQHSACLIDYANECKEAEFNEYSELLEELIRQGYNNIKILNSETIEFHRNPTKGEIKFGEGATHYRNFTISESGITKKGDLKKWFIAKDDGLRYYRN